MKQVIWFDSNSVVLLLGLKLFKREEVNYYSIEDLETFSNEIISLVDELNPDALIIDIDSLSKNDDENIKILKELKNRCKLISLVKENDLYREFFVGKMDKPLKPLSIVETIKKLIA